jgi:hypothetical protein
MSSFKGLFALWWRATSRDNVSPPSLSGRQLGRETIALAMQQRQGLITGQFEMSVVGALLGRSRAIPESSTRKVSFGWSAGRIVIPDGVVGNSSRLVAKGLPIAVEQPLPQENTITTEPPLWKLTLHLAAAWKMSKLPARASRSLWQGRPARATAGRMPALPYPALAKTRRGLIDYSINLICRRSPRAGETRLPWPEKIFVN